MMPLCVCKITLSLKILLKKKLIIYHILLLALILMIILGIYTGYNRYTPGDTSAGVTTIRWRSGTNIKGFKDLPKALPKDQSIPLEGG